jgi:hypothetical protein
VCGDESGLFVELDVTFLALTLHLYINLKDVIVLFDIFHKIFDICGTEQLDLAMLRLVLVLYGLLDEQVLTISRELNVGYLCEVFIRKL